jgi:ATP-binding cassette subfamily B multidrug efflux pump
MLFHRSIRENIAYGNPSATDEEIIDVAKKAQAHDFISILSEGYDTLVGERGIKLSGGQKQRVAIARAMLKDAPILILDEATSALDSESEVAIQEALHKLMEGKTVVAIAHRLSTLREMDRIIVLENGQIVEDGNHESLKEGGGVYQRLWEHQAGGFLVEQKKAPFMTGLLISWHMPILFVALSSATQVVLCHKPQNRRSCKI